MHAVVETICGMNHKTIPTPLVLEKLIADKPFRLAVVEIFIEFSLEILSFRGMLVSDKPQTPLPCGNVSEIEAVWRERDLNTTRDEHDDTVIATVLSLHATRYYGRVMIDWV
jgi:hypothetical protein